jgi:hypothetical protein
MAEVSQQYRQSESGGTGRRTRLRIWRGDPWGFESPLSHHHLVPALGRSFLSEVNLAVMAEINSSVNQPRINVTNAPDYREGYANSVQVRASVWDFFFSFGTAQQESPEQVNIRSFQGIYISPQQAKALWNVLGQNLAQYEQTFGKISLEPQPVTAPRPLN